MEDEDEEVNSLQFELDPSEIKSMMKADIIAAKSQNDQLVEETKNRISGLINRSVFLSCCKSEIEVDVEEFGNYEKHPTQLDDQNMKLTSGMETVLKKSLVALSQKAKTDVQVVRLMVKQATEETRDDVKAFYSHTKKTTQIVGKDLQRTYEKTINEIETRKKSFERKIKDITRNLPIPINSDNKEISVSILQELIEKSVKDFENTNEKSKEMTEAAKTDFLNRITTLFPPSRKTPEELQSETMLKENLLSLKDKVLEDIEDQKIETDESIRDTKLRLSRYPENALEQLKKFSQLSVEKVREKSNIFKQDHIENIEEESDHFVWKFSDSHDPTDLIESNEESGKSSTEKD